MAEAASHLQRSSSPPLPATEAAEASPRPHPTAAPTTTTTTTAPPLSHLSPTTSAASPSPSIRLRRQTTQDRLNGILETARARAESYAAAQAQTDPSGGAGARRHAGSVPMEPLLRNQTAPGSLAGTAELTESSADETTGIVTAARRSDGGGGGGLARHVSYQGTAGGPYGTVTPEPTSASVSASATGTRARKPSTVAASSRGSQGRNRHGATGGGGGGSSSIRTTGGGGIWRWWADFVASFQSLELENKGSVARDHLALERTFLAWLRTSLAFASIGIAVTQLFRLNTTTSDGPGGGSNAGTLRHVGRPLGTTFLGISILILFLGYHRYRQSQQWILRGKFPASRGTILLVSLVALALMVVSLVIVVVFQPSR